MKAVIVIPARMASTRFPGKPLFPLAGKPMLQWVFEAASRCGFAERILIATPDQEILAAASSFGADAMLTRADHPTGTDRLAEVAAATNADVFVNVQGDEPLIDPVDIETCVGPLLAEENCQMGSLYADASEEDLANPAVVKVATAVDGDALYFSRYAIPYERATRVEPVKRHVGLYAYRRRVLLEFATWRQTPLELAESLEQLRFLENGIRIRMSKGSGAGFGVDTPEQAAEMSRLLST